MSDEEPFAEPVRVPIEGELDLHAFAPRDIPDVVAEYLEQAWRAGLREVRPSRRHPNSAAAGEPLSSTSKIGDRHAFHPEMRDRHEFQFEMRACPRS